MKTAFGEQVSSQDPQFFGPVTSPFGQGMMKTLQLIIMGLVIGIALGYGGAYAQHLNEKVNGASYPNYRCEALSFASLPGFLFASRIRGWDYQLTQAWTLDKHRIAVLNGIVLLPVMMFLLTAMKSKDRTSQFTRRLALRSGRW